MVAVVVVLVVGAVVLSVVLLSAALVLGDGRWKSLMGYWVSHQSKDTLISAKKEPSTRSDTKNTLNSKHTQLHRNADQVQATQTKPLNIQAHRRSLRTHTNTQKTCGAIIRALHLRLGSGRAPPSAEHG